MQIKIGLPKHLIGVIASSVFMMNAIAATDDVIPNDQSSLKPIVNSGGKEIKFNWPMFKIGTAEYKEGPTGVTVFSFNNKVHAVMDVRGEPGIANTEWLRLGRDTPVVDAVVLSGGSIYGLESTTAVASAMKDDQYRTGTIGDVALSTGAIIYDLGDRRLNEVVPDKKLAQAAYRNAKEGIFRVGSAGAGRSAKSGGLFGLNGYSGQGGAFYEKGNLKIAAFAVVNPLGAVVDRDGNIQTGYSHSSWPPNLKIADLLRITKNAWGTKDNEVRQTQNTTISLIIVNQKLPNADLQRLATQVHTSMSRALQPFATQWDGDVLFAVSTDEVDLPTAKVEREKTMALLPVIASEVMWDALLSAAPEQPALPIPIKTDKVLPAKYAGKYRFSRFVTVEITAKDGKLYARATGERNAFAIPKGRSVELLPINENLTQFTLNESARYPLVLDFTGDSLVINPGLWAQMSEKR
ncbi:peptidase S58 DmpA [Polynucleobacter tropicus]|uniref:Peptidase S58 DmpA n=1 Tax=Polynucleobacter tropicus TaxID=1743174 RepID=A0A6M9PPY0_9BURK|nr:P1 family peptidase [Polynucleobacter tropicus]QKM64394.1 peptidase S58 DmpA [Polynucleobacter tropicus]